jgi:protein-tyrosine kinase
MSRIEDALRRANEGAATGASVAYADEPEAPAREDTPAEMPAVEYSSEAAANRSRTTSGHTAAADVSAVGPAAGDPRREAGDSVLEPVGPSAPPDEKLIVNDAADRIAVEQYRKVAAELYQQQGSRGMKTVMIASAPAGEGKTLTAANVALTLSESFKRKVLLVDADLRRPSIHRIFAIPGSPGLTDGLKGDAAQKVSIVDVSPCLSILPAGEAESDPLAGLSSPRMRQILESASAAFDWVIIDTPPIALLPDANLLLEMVDGIVVVIAAASTPFSLVQRALKAMDRSRIVGVVLNRAMQMRSTDYYYQYHDTSAGAAARGR